MELLDQIARTARDTPSRLAYVQADQTRLTYGQLHASIAVRREVLLKRVKAGETVLLHCCNVAEFATLLFACISAGVNVTPVAYGSTAIEIASLAARTKAKLVLTASTLVQFTAVETAHHGAASRFGDLLLPTSGTTGVAKIVRRSAASLDAVACNIVEAVGFRADDRVLAAVPLAHSYGIEHGLLAPLWAGATVHLLRGLDIDTITAADSLFDIFPAVPSMIERLADASAELPAIAKLRTIYSAGAPLPECVHARFRARFGRPIGQLYGSTEIGSVAYRAGNARPGNDVGWPMRGVSIRFVEAAARDREIAIRSSSMFSEYLNNHANLDDGHFLTGDLGRLTGDGALEIVGRSKLIIDVGGLKVDPSDVEAAIAAHPEVRECAVVAIQQSQTVCRLRALVVPRDLEAPPSAESLRAHTRSLIAAYKVPRVFEIRSDPLPRSATGKLLRTKLDDP